MLLVISSTIINQYVLHFSFEEWVLNLCIRREKERKERK